MASRYNQKLAFIGIFLLGAFFSVLGINVARGTGDPNERVKLIVERASGSEAIKPIELAATEVAVVKPVQSTSRLQVSGELRPTYIASLRAKTAGRIGKVWVREGQAVRQGELLVQFDEEELSLIYEQRKADRDAAAADTILASQTLARIMQLVEKNIAPREQLDKANAELTSTTARHESLKIQTDRAGLALRDAAVRSPFEGVIGKLSAAQGSYLGAEAELMTVVNTNVLEARMPVPTRDLPRVNVNQTIELYIDGQEEKAVVGTVARIGAVADDGSRFVPVYVQIYQSGYRFTGGMFATGTIYVAHTDSALTVPMSALRQDADGPYVLKLESGFLTRQPVTLADSRRTDRVIEIRKGLSDGDTIIVAPLKDLLPNMPAIITKAG